MTFSTLSIKKSSLLFCIFIFYSINGFGQSYNMPTSGSLTITDCTGDLYDSGGPNESAGLVSNSIATISIPNAISIYISFLEFDFENGFDFISIYDGPDINSPLIIEGTGTELLWNTYFSNGNSITIVQDTDQFFSATNFHATFGCSLPAPTPDFTFDHSSCNGQVDFSDLSEGIIDSWNWDFGNGDTSTSQNPNYQYTESGDYEVSLTTSNINDTVTLSLPIEIYILNPEDIIPEFSIIGNYVDFSLTNIEPWWTVHWDYGDGNSSNFTAPFHTYETVDDTTFFTAKVTITDPLDSCTVIKELEITILPLIDGIDQINNIDFTIFPKSK